jgi:hypothetical protein
LNWQLPVRELHDQTPQVPLSDGHVFTLPHTSSCSLVPIVPASGDGTSVAQLGSAAPAPDATASAPNSRAIPFDVDVVAWVVISASVLRLRTYR